MCAKLYQLFLMSSLLLLLVGQQHSVVLSKTILLYDDVEVISMVMKEIAILANYYRMREDLLAQDNLSGFIKSP
jgi:hypothetical protein